MESTSCFLLVCISQSLNADNGGKFTNLSGRIGINWLTRNHLKFQMFGALGLGSKIHSHGMATFESGFMMGKLRKCSKNGVLDLNIGVAYLGRKPSKGLISSLANDSNWLKVEEAHTIGIPIEVSVYSASSALKVGLGIAANLNIKQPYIGFLLSTRFGNPVLKMHSSSNRYHSSRI